MKYYIVNTDADYSMSQSIINESGLVMDSSVSLGKSYGIGSPEVVSANASFWNHLGSPLQRRLIRSGEVACLMAHVALWRECGDDWGVFLEADADVSSALSSQAESAAEYATAKGHDVVYLGWIPPCNGSDKPSEEFFTPVDRVHGTHAYMLSRKAMDTLLAMRPGDNPVPVNELLDSVCRGSFFPQLGKKYPTSLSAIATVTPILQKPHLSTVQNSPQLRG